MTGITDKQPNWEARLWALLQRRNFSAGLALGLVLLAVFLGSFTYMLLTGLTPFAPSRILILTLLISNLSIVLVLFALIIWRVFRIITARVSGRAGAKLHARMVTMFAIVAVMPAIIVAVFAAVTLNRGLDTWFSERIQLIISNAQQVAEAYLTEHDHVLRGDVLAMANDLDRAAAFLRDNPQRFQQILTAQAALRSLPAALLINNTGKIIAEAKAPVSPNVTLPTPEQFASADEGGAVLSTEGEQNQIRALVRLSAYDGTYLYVARFVDARVLDHLEQTREAVNEYQSLEKRRITFQVTFALIYVAVALITLLAAIWLGLWAANRIVDPISKLVQASERVSQGDLTALVDVVGTGDELDALSSSFNRMTGQLSAQRKDLIEANKELDERRQFTEAVLSGVSAGVLGIDRDGIVNHANRTSLRFFNRQEGDMIDHDLTLTVPEMAHVVQQAQLNPERVTQEQVVIFRNGQERTLNVRISSEVTGNGHGDLVLTFDDITELVRAQRTSAWADVARRIAHEIKNPLTPIQLSAERLRRKYGREITTDPEIFEQCTETIIRQVNDIGRMVDEFSSFARMPTATMKPVAVNEILRQSVFLQRVAFPDIDYQMVMPSEDIILECDSRLLSQALINILKNAAEAIRGHDAEDQKIDEHASREKTIQGRIEAKLVKDGNDVIFMVTDSGCGLPETDRTRLTEPYMTTRTKGTGLGLAIVNKVMEDHAGTLMLTDAPASEGWESGARVTLTFPYRNTQAAAEASSADAEIKTQEAVNGV